jgi:metallo-beta-lactamase family protein
MDITFAGDADTVTGSRPLLNLAGHRLLLDCGLFQGFKTLRQRNWADPGFDVKSINTVVLSHAHLDHCGFLPVLVKLGFKGDVICSQATAHLAQIMLLDSAHLLEEEAKHANTFGYSKHAPAQPLYTVDDVKRCLKQFKPLAFNTALALSPRLSVTLTPAGHLLGAATVTVKDRAVQLVFSGDLGRTNDLLMLPPAAMHAADVLLVESTYGNRVHPAENALERLAGIIRSTASRGGIVLMPSFAVGRAQALMLAIARLKKEKAIPAVPVYLDSPMAIKAQVSHIEGFSGHADAQELMQWLQQFHRAPQHTFVVHGEREAADALRLQMQDTLGWPVQTVEHLQRVQV